MVMRVALVGGPMYDGLYSLLPDRRRGRRARGPSDLEPSRRRAAGGRGAHRRRLHALEVRPVAGAVAHPTRPIARDATSLPRAVDLCTFDGALLCVPRNDRRARDVGSARPPRRSPAHVGRRCSQADAVFGFTGRESGLFGTFFEHVAAHGGDAFRRRPAADARHHRTRSKPSTRCAASLTARPTDVAVMALRRGRRRARCRHRRHGRDLARRLRGSPRLARPLVTVAPSVPLRSRRPALVLRVPRVGDAAHVRRRARGASTLIRAAFDVRSPCARRRRAAPCAPTSMRSLRSRRSTTVDAARLDIIRATIADGMITYPPLPRFPEVEDVGWSSINAALERRALSDRGHGRGCKRRRRYALARH